MLANFNDLFLIHITDAQEYICASELLKVILKVGNG